MREAHPPRRAQHSTFPEESPALWPRHHPILAPLSPQGRPRLRETRPCMQGPAYPGWTPAPAAACPASLFPGSQVRRLHEHLAWQRSLMTRPTSTLEIPFLQPYLPSSSFPPGLWSHSDSWQGASAAHTDPDCNLGKNQRDKGSAHIRRRAHTRGMSTAPSTSQLQPPPPLHSWPCTLALWGLVFTCLWTSQSCVQHRSTPVATLPSPKQPLPPSMDPCP